MSVFSEDLGYRFSLEQIVDVSQNTITFWITGDAVTIDRRGRKNFRNLNDTLKYVQKQLNDVNPDRGVVVSIGYSRITKDAAGHLIQFMASAARTGKGTIQVHMDRCEYEPGEPGAEQLDELGAKEMLNVAMHSIQELTGATLMMTDDQVWSGPAPRGAAAGRSRGSSPALHAGTRKWTFLNAVPAKQPQT